MSSPRYHPAHCLCARCNPRHPAATSIFLHGLVRVAALGAALAAGGWAGSLIDHLFSSWS